MHEDMRKLCLSILEGTIEYMDLTFKNSSRRLKYYNVNKSNCYRSIMTIFGELKFTRTYYQDKNKSNKFYFIDTLFKFDKYSRYDSTTKAIAIDYAVKTNQKLGGELYNDVINPFQNNNNHSICRQTIYNWISKWNIPNINYSEKETLESLFIMVDEKYIHEQIKNVSIDNIESKLLEEITDEVMNGELTEKGKISTKKSKNFIMSKCFVAFNGIEQKNKRKVLKNRTVFLTADKSPWTRFIDSISRIYDFTKIKTITTLTDAGTWITAGFSELKLYAQNKIINCLCEFHSKQKINRITRDNDLRTELNKYIAEDNKTNFINLVNKISEEKSEKRKETINSYLNYIVKHWNWIKNMEKSKYKSSMESHISHNVASYFGSRPKGFGRKNIEKLLKLQEYKANGININNLYINSYSNKEIITTTENEINYSMFDKNTVNNVPIINSGQVTELYKTLVSIAHS